MIDADDFEEFKELNRAEKVRRLYLLFKSRETKNSIQLLSDEDDDDEEFNEDEFLENLLDQVKESASKQTKPYLRIVTYDEEPKIIFISQHLYVIKSWISSMFEEGSLLFKQSHEFRRDKNLHILVYEVYTSVLPKVFKN